MCSQCGAAAWPGHFAAARGVWPPLLAPTRRSAHCSLADEEWVEAWPHRFEALYTISLEQPDPAEPSDREFLQQASEKYQPWVQRQKAARTGGRKAGGAAAGKGEEERQPLTPSVLRCLLQARWAGRGGL